MIMHRISTYFTNTKGRASTHTTVASECKIKKEKEIQYWGN